MFQPYNVYECANSFIEERISVEDEGGPGTTVSDWLRHQSKDFQAEGIRKPVHRREKCVTVLGQYIEK